MKNKHSKTSVNYREATTAEHCGNCSMFRRIRGEHGECTIVSGGINAYDVCDKWEPGDENT